MKTFILACLCFNLFDIRLLDVFSMMGRCSTANLPMPLSLTMVKHLLAEAPWTVTASSWHGRNLCTFHGSQRTLLPCHASICYFFVEREPLKVTDPWLQSVHILLSSGYQQAWVFQISVSLQALLSISFLKDMIAAIFVQMPENLAGATSMQTSVRK